MEEKRYAQVLLENNKQEPCAINNPVPVGDQCIFQMTALVQLTQLNPYRAGDGNDELHSYLYWNHTHGCCLLTVNSLRNSKRLQCHLSFNHILLLPLVVASTFLLTSNLRAVQLVTHSRLHQQLFRLSSLQVCAFLLKIRSHNFGQKQSINLALSNEGEPVERSSLCPACALWCFSDWMAAMQSQTNCSSVT